jgi:hypothetical protein
LDRNNADNPTPGVSIGEIASIFTIHFTDSVILNNSPQVYYKYSSARNHQILGDLVAAYGFPIKMSFGVAT